MQTGAIERFGFGQDVVEDFQRGEDQIVISEFIPALLNDVPLTFAQLDSNGNGVLDDGDEAVEIRSATLDGVAQISTIIDAEAAIGLSVPGSHTLTIYGVTGLTVEDVGG